MAEIIGDTGFAVIDIGSNSVRMVIYDLSVVPPEQVFNEKIYCAMGRDLATSGKLNPDGVEVAFDAIHTYLTVAREHGADHIHAVATAAVRDAKDGPDFATKVERDLGLKIRILSGDEEAQYAATGVLALDPEADGVVVDFGGGSLELALVHPERIFNTVSLPLGAFRAQTILDEEHDDARAEARIRDLLSPYKSEFGKQQSLYAIGGSWRALAKAHMIRHGLFQDVQGYAIPSNSLIPFCKLIEKTPVDVLEDKYKLEGHKAKLAAVSAKMLRLTVEVLQPEVFVTSQAGVRDGLVYEFLTSQAKGAYPKNKIGLDCRYER